MGLIVRTVRIKRIIKDNIQRVFIAPVVSGTRKDLLH